MYILPCVLQIVSEGLAAQDGRLRKGDVIQKVKIFTSIVVFAGKSALQKL